MSVAMRPTIEFLPESQQALLEEIIRKIAAAVHPEKIICYGIRSSRLQEWGCFLDKEGPGENTRLCFDLLIIADAARGQSEQDISQVAEQRAEPMAEVCCITHKIHAVNSALTEGNPFFCALYYKGIFLYDAGRTALVGPAQPDSLFLKRHIVETYWSRWYGLALNFYKGANESLVSGRADITVFMLHQATEHTCGALIRVFTGYRPNTHNLTRLLTITESFTNKLTAVFPCNTKEEEELYAILQHGYSDARYKDVYEVPAATLAILMGRVQKLQDIAATLYTDRLAFYGLQERSRFPIMENAE